QWEVIWGDICGGARAAFGWLFGKSDAKKLGIEETKAATLQRDLKAEQAISLKAANQPKDAEADRGSRSAAYEGVPCTVLVAAGLCGSVYVHPVAAGLCPLPSLAGRAEAHGLQQGGTAVDARRAPPA